MIPFERPASRLATPELSEAAHWTEKIMRTSETSARIRQLNDQFRKCFCGGRVMITQGVDALPSDLRAKAIRNVATFEAFNLDNDPHNEHDFGSFDLAGQKFFWKIDYYSPDLQGGSEDPSDPAKTARVLTIMLAQEY